MLVTNSITNIGVASKIKLLTYPGVSALKLKMSQLRYFKASIKEKIWGFIF